MNTGKTKVMFSCSMKDKVEEKGEWPCGVCKKGVGNNSILCHGCKKWIHKRCSGVKGSLRNASSRSSADAVRQIVQSEMGLAVKTECVSVFYGTFSTNRLYHPVEVRDVSHRGEHKYHAIKQ